MIKIVDSVIFYADADGNRVSYYPGQDVSSAPQEVQDAAALHWTPEAVAAWQIANAPAPEPTPTDWDGFNNAILSDADFNAVFATVNSSHPLIAASLPAALAQVASGQTSMFSTVYNQICTLGGATVAQREGWATLAETYHCPAEFVAVIRGA